MDGVRRIDLDVSAQAHDEAVDHARLGLGLQTPHPLEQLPARDRLPLPLDQRPQQAGLPGRELHRLVTAREFETVEAHRHVALASAAVSFKPLFNVNGKDDRKVRLESPGHDPVKLPDVINKNYFNVMPNISPDGRNLVFFRYPSKDTDGGVTSGDKPLDVDQASDLTSYVDILAEDKKKLRKEKDVVYEIFMDESLPRKYNELDEVQLNFLDQQAKSVLVAPTLQSNKNQ